MNFGVWIASMMPDDNAPPTVAQSVRSAGHATLVDLVFVGAVVVALLITAAARYVYLVRHEEPRPPSTTT